MAFKPNYNQQRAERSRSKEQKKQEKLQKREEDAAKRKTERDDTSVEPQVQSDGDESA